MPSRTRRWPWPAPLARGQPPRSARPGRADPDEQFLLDVNIRQLRLGDGVRAYQTPEGTCVVFGDFLTALDVPMKIDLAAKRRVGLGVQGRTSDRHRPGAGRRRFAATARKSWPRHGPRNAGGLVRRQRRAQPLVRDRGQADHRRIGADARIRGQTAGRAGDRARKARGADQAGRDAARRSAARSNCPIACGGRPRSISSSTPGVTYHATTE